MNFFGWFLLFTWSTVVGRVMDYFFENKEINKIYQKKLRLKRIKNKE